MIVSFAKLILIKFKDHEKSKILLHLEIEVPLMGERAVLDQGKSWFQILATKCDLQWSIDYLEVKRLFNLAMKI